MGNTALLVDNGPYKEEFEIFETPDSDKKVVIISTVTGELIENSD